MAAGYGFMDKQTVLAQAAQMLNRQDQPWEARVEGDSIIGYWKWMNAYFFGLHEVNDETKQYTFTVTLSNNGTYKELDQTEDKKRSINFSGGQLSLGSSKDTFKGKANKKSYEFGLGKDKDSGKIGAIGFKYNTTDVKQPIRDYLASCGWKKG